MSFFQQVSRGKASIATPFKTPEPEMVDSEEEIDFQMDMDKAKALSLKEINQAPEIESESDTVIESEIQVDGEMGISNLTVPPETQPKLEGKTEPTDELKPLAEPVREDESSRASHTYNTRARKSLNPTDN